MFKKRTRDRIYGCAFRTTWNVSASTYGKLIHTIASGQQLNGGRKLWGEASLTNNIRWSLLGTDTKTKMSAGLLGSSRRRFTCQGGRWRCWAEGEVDPTRKCGWGPGLSSSHVVNSRACLVLQHQPQLKQGNQGFVSLPQSVVGLGWPSGTDVILGEAAPSNWCQRPPVFPTAGLWGPQSGRGIGQNTFEFFTK